MKNLLELLDKKPDVFDRAYYDESYKKPYRLTVVLCQPRSGSSLLLRLMNSACLTFMVGDRPVEFYEGQIKIWKALQHPGIYGHPIELERQGIFPDEYRGTSKLREQYLFRYYAALNFGDGAHHCGSCKTTSVGFNNDLVADYVEMLRTCYANSLYQQRSGLEDFDLTIGFMTRDHDEIIRSFQTREGPGQQTAIEQPELLRNLLESQLQQFRDAYDLGDVVFTYKDLIENPIHTLKKLNPIYEPNEPAVKEILSKVIR